MNPQKRSPAPRGNAEDRAECSSDERISTTTEVREEDFAARYVARRYRLKPCFARVVVTLAGIGGALL
jgi:hypothetical protein